MRSYIKALIFDLDGTLADTLPAICEAVNLTMLALSQPTLTEAEVRLNIGKGPRHLVEQSLPRAARTADPTLVDRALDVYNEMYGRTYLHTDRLYGGLLDVIVELSKYYKIAVLTNKQDAYARELVRVLLPEGLCTAVRGTLDGIPAKPQPDAALALVESLGCTPHECMLIGDGSVDIQTAENAELDILSVSWGYSSKTKLIMSGAMEIVNSPSELLEYFK